MTDLLRLESIRSTDWQMKVGELGGVVEGIADVDQCIRTILLTPRGGVPHRPEFGCDLWRYVDWPVDEARPQIVREVLDALEEWEPRAEVLGVTVEVDPDQLGAVVVQIARRLRGTAEEGTTAVRIAA